MNWSPKWHNRLVLWGNRKVIIDQFISKHELRKWPLSIFDHENLLSDMVPDKLKKVVNYESLQIVQKRYLMKLPSVKKKHVNSFLEVTFFVLMMCMK